MSATQTAPKNSRGISPLATPTDLSSEGVAAISEGLRGLLADVFALYVKTKNFHWHMSGPHFRDYHLLLDEQAGQIFAMTDDIAERARKIGGTSLRSIGDIAKHQQLKDNDEEFVAPQAMLAELAADNQHLTRLLRDVHDVCDEHKDVATASLLETWIDETERRTWFLFESAGSGGPAPDADHPDTISRRVRKVRYAKPVAIGAASVRARYETFGRGRLRIGLPIDAMPGVLIADALKNRVWRQQGSNRGRAHLARLPVNVKRNPDEGA